jgi:hypothetical protein
VIKSANILLFDAIRAPRVERAINRSTHPAFNGLKPRAMRSATVLTVRQGGNAGDDVAGRSGLIAGDARP